MSTYQVKVDNRMLTTLVINTQSRLDQSLNFILSSSIKKDENMKRVVGIDIEIESNNVETGSTSSSNNRSVMTERVVIVKLCYGTTVLTIQLCSMSEPPRSLFKFLQLREISFVGVGMKHIVEALERDYGIKCRNAVDLGELAARVKENEKLKGYGLLDLAETVPGLYTADVKTLPSTYAAAALTCWGGESLSKQQVEAATWAAFLCFCVGNTLLGGRLSDDSISRTSNSYDFYYGD